MRQAVLLFIAFGAILFLLACGHGGRSTSTTANTVVISPSTLSLNQTDVASVTARVLDSAGTAVTNAKAIVFTSDTPTVVTVNPTNGAVCAGTWDASYLVCSAGQVGKATITATSGGLTATATVYVHAKVDHIVINTSGACKSMGQTLQLSATAFSNGTDVTSTVGPFNWKITAANVASVDSNGILTAQAPGTTTLYASVSNVTSAPVTYTTCGVRSINLHTTGAANTAFSMAVGGTQNLTADVIDTAGNTISPTLTWVSLQPAISTVTTAGAVAGIAPGTTSIVAECATTCNYNLPPVYSNAAVPTVTGTSASTVYVTGTAATQMIPIDTGTNTAGTAITLPSTPNSFVFLPSGLTAFLGSSSGLMALSTASNTVTQNTAIPGKVLTVSPDSNFVVVASASTVYVQNSAAGSSSTSFAISGATAAAFSPDTHFLYIAAGTNLYIYDTVAQTLSTQTMTAAVNDVAALPSAAFMMLAGGSPHAITAFSTCDSSPAANFIAPATPTNLAVTPDASTVLAPDSPNIDVLTRTSLAQPGCPPPITATLTSVNLGQGTFTPNKFLLSTDGSKAYITSDLASVIAFNVSANTASAIALANGATGLSESMTLDGAKLYVGGSDNNVHRIDTAAGTDAQQISVGFKPDLVVVRPK